MHNVTAALLQITVVSYYKLWQIYYKLQQNVITNYCSFITNYDSAALQIRVALLQITTKCYYKLQQPYYKLRQCIITNYGSFIKLLQITVAFGAITNYGRYYNLRRYYKLLRNISIQFYVFKQSYSSCIYVKLYTYNSSYKRIFVLMWQYLAILSVVNYIPKMLYLRSLTGFWVRLFYAFFQCWFSNQCSNSCFDLQYLRGRRTLKHLFFHTDV